MKSPRGVMAKVLDYSLEVNEFELYSFYYVYFSTKYPWEKYEPRIPPAIG